ncbi:hypothetical protein C8R43DRAFT_949464 [Mycena crocata]|nr:hypothetical protein C8R43DRAFT_949464 [Mycena crocata]
MVSTSKLRQLSKAKFGEHFELGPAAPSSDGKLLSHYVHPGSRLRAEFLVVGRVTAGEHVKVVEFGRPQDPADLYLPDFDGARSALLAAKAAGEEHDRSKKSVFDYGINLASEQVKFTSPEATVLEVGGVVFIFVTLCRVDVPVLIPGSVDPSHARLLNTLPHDPSQICVYRIQFIFPFDVSLSYKEKGIVAIERLQWHSIPVPFHEYFCRMQRQFMRQSAATLAKADFGKRECNGNQKKRPEDGDFEVVRGTSAETPTDMIKGTQQDDDSTDKDMSPQWQ